MTRFDADHKTRTRARILDAADRLIKARGVEAASVHDVMREAGLTVGGFYAHFSSKEALASEALLTGLTRNVDHLLASLEGIPDGAPWVRALVDRYLAQVYEPDLGQACPLTLRLPDLARANDDARNAFAAHTGALLSRIATHFPETPGISRRDAVLFVYSSCAGAVAIARAVTSPEARRRILGSTRDMTLRALGIDR